jgi:hypothetical protein
MVEMWFNLNAIADASERHDESLVGAKQREACSGPLRRELGSMSRKRGFHPCDMQEHPSVAELLFNYLLV